MVEDFGILGILVWDAKAPAGANECLVGDCGLLGQVWLLDVVVKTPLHQIELIFRSSRQNVYVHLGDYDQCSITEDDDNVQNLCQPLPLPTSLGYSS